MISLPKSGLPISLDVDSGKLIMDSTVTSDPPQARTLFESLPYYVHPETEDGNKPLYYMYRNVRLGKDIASIEKSHFRYDITVVLPGQVGMEPIKTIGHVHPLSVMQLKPYTYTEVYSVIYGTAHYILQKFSSDFSKIVSVVDLEVNAGEHVLIPSFYGHVTVNVSHEPLVMANILYRDFLSNYDPYKNNKGAALYLTRNSGGEIISVKNDHYLDLPDPIQARSTDFVAPELTMDEPLYPQWIKNLNDFMYLYQEI